MNYCNSRKNNGDMNIQNIQGTCLILTLVIRTDHVLCRDYMNTWKLYYRSVHSKNQCKHACPKLFSLTQSFWWHGSSWVISWYFKTINTSRLYNEQTSLFHAPASGWPTWCKPAYSVVAPASCQSSPNKQWRCNQANRTIASQDFHMCVFSEKKNKAPIISLKNNYMILHFSSNTTHFHGFLRPRNTACPRRPGIAVLNLPQAD